MVDFAPILDQIRERFVLSDMIRQQVKLTRKGHEFSGLCPFHKEKTPSFTVNDQKAFYYCFGCGARGDVITYVMHQRNLPFKDAVEELAKEAGIVIPKTTNIKTEDAEVLNVLEEACQFYEANLQKTFGDAARTYLEKRQFSKETVSFFRLGYAPDERKDGISLYQVLVKKFPKDLLMKTGLFLVPDHGGDPFDRFRGRLMFPIHDLQGQVVAFGGRTLGNGEPKYLNSPESVLFHKGTLLYNYHHAKKHVRPDLPFIVAEGYCDVIALYQAGFQSAVAPLGTALTIQQMELMWRRCQNPIVCFDGDLAGQKAMWRAAERALPHITEEKTLCFVPLPAGEDPDSLLRQKKKDFLNDLFKTPIPLSAVVWEHTKKDFEPLNALSPEKKAFFKKTLSDQAALIQNQTVRNFYQQDLLRRFSQAFFKLHDASKQKPLDVTPLVVKKNTLWQKILLAIIIRHPKLLIEVFEQFFQIRFEDDEFAKIQSFLSHYDMTQEQDTLEKALVEEGFGPVLNSIFDRSLLVHAPFLKEGAAEADVLEGWNHIWNRHIVQRQIRQDSKTLVDTIKTSLDKDLWQRLKTLKNRTLTQ